MARGSRPAAAPPCPRAGPWCRCPRRCGFAVCASLGRADDRDSRTDLPGHQRRRHFGHGPAQHDLTNGASPAGQPAIGLAHLALPGRTLSVGPPSRQLRWVPARSSAVPVPSARHVARTAPISAPSRAAHASPAACGPDRASACSAVLPGLVFEPARSISTSPALAPADKSRAGRCHQVRRGSSRPRADLRSILLSGRVEVGGGVMGRPSGAGGQDKP